MTSRTSSEARGRTGGAVVMISIVAIVSYSGPPGYQHRADGCVGIGYSSPACHASTLRARALPPVNYYLCFLVSVSLYPYPFRGGAASDARASALARVRALALPRIRVRTLSRARATRARRKQNSKKSYFSRDNGYVAQKKVCAGIPCPAQNRSVRPERLRSRSNAS